MQLNTQNHIRHWMFSLTGIIVLSGATIWFFFISREQKEVSLLKKIEQEAKAERWENVLDLCTTFFDQQPDNREKDSLYFEVVDYTKFALCLTNQLPNQFFAYAKYFDRSVLFPDGSSTINTMLFAPKLAYFYYSVGLQNMAMHQSFGCIVQDQSPIWAMELYLKSAQIRGLDSYGDVFRAQLKSANTCRLNDSTLQAKRALLPTNTEETAWNLDWNMRVLFNGNPTNKFAFEYVMTTALTYKEHGFVMKHLNLLPTFGYDSLPKHFEEAILADLFFRPDGNGHPLGRIAYAPTDAPTTDTYAPTHAHLYGGFQLRPETINRMNVFLELLQTFQNTGMGFSKIKHQFQDTYWFHYVFGDITPKHAVIPIENQISLFNQKSKIKNQKLYA